MGERADFLVEIGTEELPPKALTRMARAFRDVLVAAAVENQLIDSAEGVWYSSPRRLAVLIPGMRTIQPDQQEYRRGPPLSAAYKDGKPTRAAEGFAKTCGVTMADLDTEDTDKGIYMVYRATRSGRPASEVLPALVERALAQLPIQRRMRWGDSDREFVRPVHWVLMRIGKQVVEGEVLGVTIGGTTQGHRFHHPKPIEVKDPAKYKELLAKKGKVLVNDAEGELYKAIAAQIAAQAKAVDGYVEHDETSALVQEVACLVEWPVALTGRYDAKYLELPSEVIAAVLEGHQRYFPLRDGTRQLLPRFITVANIQSKHPERVQHGNERVIEPRLADAMFFWNTDRLIRLEHRCALLKDVLYHRQLGSLEDRTERVSILVQDIAGIIGATKHLAKRAAQLAKADLTTEMVGEFPELQGVMGRYYALNDGEESEVAAALEDQYRPRFAGDTLPESDSGAALAIADKMDTIVGMFAIGEPPTGDKDPFAVRRAALGVLRIIIEARIDLDLAELIDLAARNLPVEKLPEGLRDQVLDYMMDRLRAYYADRGLRADVFEAVLAKRPSRPVDFDNRMHAVTGFMELDAAADLAAANKRISNILRKSGSDGDVEVDNALLTDSAEIRLNGLVERLEITVVPLFEQGRYTVGLEQLADLKDPVDTFFEEVMVMAEDEALRNNRLALLQRTRALFLHTADLSKVQAG